MPLNKKLFDYKSFGRIYYDTTLDEYTVNVDGFAINGAVVGTSQLDPALIDDLEDSILTAVYNVDLSPINSATAQVTGSTEITFTLSTTLKYAGIEWGVDPALTWSILDVTQSTDHVIVINGLDGISSGTTYAWRPYVTDDPLDAVENRVYGTISNSTITLPVVYDTDALAIINAMNAIIAPQVLSVDFPAYPAAINQFVINCKADGNWSDLDVLEMYAAPTEACALLNWKTATSIASNTGCTFTANQGFTGNGTSAFVTVGRADNAGGNYTLDDASFGVYIRTMGTGVGLAGANTRQTIARTVFSINSSSNQAISDVGTTGLRSNVRTSSTASETFIGGTSGGTSANVSAALNGQTFWALRRSSAFDTSQASSFFIGASKTSTELANLQTRIASFLTAVA